MQGTERAGAHTVGCKNVAMHSDGRGRPRLEQSRRPGKTAREEILDAAAELFTSLGYASTSTRRIAEAVGVRQASLYHHFATKDDILDALLAGTVDAPLMLADELLRERGPAAPRLHALVVSDVTQLCASRWNLGALYLLPELRVDRFEPFRLRRDQLRAHYRRLAADVIAQTDGPAEADDLPFRLVESVINGRSDDSGCPPDQPWIIADGALRTLGWDGDFDRMRKLTSGRLRLEPVSTVTR
ncbi:MAG: transcriptional regulator [Mycobacterium sp.]|nr:transcriptional regulator [Mycobacterium sp.]